MRHAPAAYAASTTPCAKLSSQIDAEFDWSRARDELDGGLISASGAPVPEKLDDVKPLSQQALSRTLDEATLQELSQGLGVADKANLLSETLRGS